jgi:hypothetical protein
MPTVWFGCLHDVLPFCYIETFDLVNSSFICRSKVRLRSLTFPSPFQDLLKEGRPYKTLINQNFCFFSANNENLWRFLFYRYITFIYGVVVRNKNMASPEPEFLVVSLSRSWICEVRCSVDSKFVHHLVVQCWNLCEVLCHTKNWNHEVFRAIQTNFMTYLLQGKKGPWICQLNPNFYPYVFCNPIF